MISLVPITVVPSSRTPTKYQSPRLRSSRSDPPQLFSSEHDSPVGMIAPGQEYHCAKFLSSKDSPAQLKMKVLTIAAMIAVLRRTDGFEFRTRSQ